MVNFRSTLVLSWAVGLLTGLDMQLASAFAVCAHRGSSTPALDQHSNMAPISPIHGLASSNFFGLTFKVLSFMSFQTVGHRQTTI